MILHNSRESYARSGGGGSVCGDCVFIVWRDELLSVEIETVLFDLDDTLCEYRQSTAGVLACAFERVGVEPFFEAAEYTSRYNDFAERTDSIDGLRTACFAAIAGEYDRDPSVGREVAAAYADEREYGDVRLLPGVATVVKSLGSAYRLGIVTNGPPETQTQKLAAIGLADAFEVVVNAGFETRSKPSPEPFHRALSELDGSPELAVHVGNSLDSDVTGAQAAGLHAVWLSDGTDPDPVPDYTIDEMAELRNPPWNGA